MMIKKVLYFYLSDPRVLVYLLILEFPYVSVGTQYLA